MITDKKRPPGQVGGRGKIERFGDAFNHQNTASSTNLQAFRVAFLARRHRLAPAFAAAVAGLAFTEEAMK